MQELLLEDMTQRGVEYMLKENRNTLDYKDVGKLKNSLAC